MSIAPAPARTWESLRPFEHEIAPADQVLIVAMNKGAKSTLAATLLMDVDSLVALDGKGRLTLPRARIVQLPPYPDGKDPDLPAWDRAVARAVAWQTGPRRTAWQRLTNNHPEVPTNRVILRMDAADVDRLEPHDRLFRLLFRLRPETILWIDEITSTGATASRPGRYLPAISARGRTQGTGLWTMTQAPYGIVPPVLRRNAHVMIFGPIEPEDAADIHRPLIELAVSIPPGSGRFLVYVTGEREPYRLYLPIPRELRHWEAP